MRHNAWIVLCDFMFDLYPTAASTTIFINKQTINKTYINTNKLSFSSKSILNLNKLEMILIFPFVSYSSIFTITIWLTT